MVARMNSMCAVSLPERTQPGSLPTWRPCRGCPHTRVERRWFRLERRPDIAFLPGNQRCTQQRSPTRPATDRVNYLTEGFGDATNY
jgi:hypothetical protein